MDGYDAAAAAAIGESATFTRIRISGSVSRIQIHWIRIYFKESISSSMNSEQDKGLMVMVISAAIGKSATFNKIRTRFR